MTEEITAWFIKEVEKLDLWSDSAVRNSSSKHQRMIKQLLELIEEYKLKYYEELEKNRPKK
jgi:hypothetical protein